MANEIQPNQGAGLSALSGMPGASTSARSAPKSRALARASAFEGMELSSQASSLPEGPRAATTLAAPAPPGSGARLRAYGAAQAAGWGMGTGFDSSA
jgi:hypothetical protein